MTVKLRNTSGVALRVNGKTVEVDEVITVDGSVAKDSPADAYQIGQGDTARLYPHALWTTNEEKA